MAERNGVDAGTVPKPTDAPAPTEAEIEKLNYRSGIKLLRRLGVETFQMKTVEDIKTFLRLRYINNQARPNMTFHDMEPDIRENNRRRQHLVSICESIETAMASGGDGVREIENDLEPGLKDGWETKLRALREYMQKQKTPILVAGETGSGKSSLINLMIGQQLLPEAEQPCTGVICSIHNGDKRMVRLKKSPTDTTILHLDSNPESEADARKHWEEFITSRDLSPDQFHKRAQFYCPLPYLGDSVYFVDSPGIRETRLLDNVLHRYLPKCSAFVVVLMSDNCTGFNEPVERFIRSIRAKLEDYNVNRLDTDNQWPDVGGLTAESVTADSVIFVFNRWDKVEDYETKERTRQLRHSCLTKLSRLWPVVKENKNVFFMSVSKIFSMIQHKASPPDDFVRFQAALNTLVPKCLNARLTSAYTWLENLARSFLDLTRSKLNFARHHTDEKLIEAEMLRNLLARLDQTFDERLTALDSQIREKRGQLRIQLLNHLRSEEALQRMCDFNRDQENYESFETLAQEQLPEGDDFETVGMQLQIFFIRRIDREIRHWNERDAYEEVIVDGQVTHRRLNTDATKFSLFHTEIKDLCRSTFEEIDKQAQVLNDLLKSDSVGMNYSGKDLMAGKSEFLSNLEKVFFGMTAVIWIPLVLVGGAISFPVIASIVTYDKIGNKKKLKNYNENRFKWAQNWLRNFVHQSFDERLLDDLIYEAILVKIQQVQTRVKNYKDPAIKKFNERIDNLTKDTRSLSSVKRLFNPILGRVEDILKDIYGFHAQFLKVYDFDKSDFINLRENAINMGAFGDIYRTESRSMQREVAVKVIKQSISKGAALEIYTEEVAWRRLCQEKKPNILRLYGLVFFGESEGRIGFVMELCDGTLEELLKTNPKLVPFRQKTNFAKEDSFRHTLQLAVQLTEGLSVVHGVNFVHRDLKLANILYQKKDNKYILKLCDFGLSKGRTDVTTTTAGTTLYMSPEVLSQQGCSSSSDIYSLGLMFWEMYHGRQVFASLTESCHSMFELSDKIRNGQAKMDYPDPDLPSSFHSLLESCVKYEARERPKVEAVLASLITMESNLACTFRMKIAKD